MYISRLLLTAVVAGSVQISSAAALVLTNDSTATTQVADSLSIPDVTLDDIVVTGTKKLIKSDGATLTYSVEEDPEAATNSTLEILRKVPGVTVDANDDIKVNGQSSFKIYLNGREDPMLKGDVKTILKSMPAATIKRIEVISEPGAKYEAEGTGGILNIVTITKQSLSGYLTNLNFYLSSNNTGGSAYARTKVGNVTGSAQVSYNNGRLFHRYNTYESTIENLESDINHLQTSSGRSRNSWDYLGGNLNLSWEPDTLNLFTFGGNISNNTWGSPSEISMRMLSKDMTERWSLRRTTVPDGQWFSLSAQLSFQHNFRRPDHHLIASYSYTHGKDKNNSDMYTYDIKGDYTFNDSPYTRETNDSYNNSHIFQLDYSNTINDRHLLEAGGKMNLNSDRSENAQWYGTASDNLSIDESQHVNVKQFRDIYALYASYKGNFGKWSFRAGVRYEHTRMGLKYRLGDHPDFTTILNDVVPNLSATFKMTEASNFRLAYQMRISRPGLYVLNPFRNTSTPGTVRYGNPDLKSERSNNISLSYSNYGGKLSGTVKVNYFFSSNQVSDMIFMKDGLMNTTYANIGNYNNVSFEGNLNWSIVRDLNLSLWMRETYTHMTADSEMLKAKRVNWRTNLNANIDYRFPCKVRLSAYGGYGSPWVDLQSKGTSWYYYGLGVSRSFLKEDALTINLNTSNFLPAYRSSNWSQVSETVRTTSSSRYPQWTVGIGISYRFGGLKADVKRTAATIEGDQTSGAGSKGGGNN